MNFPWSILLITMIAYGGFAHPSMGEKPSELLLAEQHRAAIDTASIEFRLSGKPEPEPGYFSAKLAGEDVLYTYRGLADGRFNVENQPGDLFTYSELRYLMKGDEQWTYLEHTTSGHIKTAGIVWLPYYDICSLGFDPAPVTAEPQDHWFRTPAERYEVEHRPDAVEILGFWSNGFIVRTLLDPTRAMQPIRAETLVDGEEAGVCETQYQQVKDFWFPSVSKFTFHGEVITTITVLHAEFNEPYHPSSFSPEDLGLTPGIDVYREPSLGAYRWSGTGLISKEEWAQGLKDGSFDDSALKILRANANPDATTGGGRYPRDMDDGFLGLTAVVRRKPGLWEDFTRRFIRFCKLDENQTGKAWEVLKQCQKGAYERLPGIEKESKSVELELAQLRRGAVADKTQMPDGPAKQPIESASGAESRSTGAPVQNAPPPASVPDQKPSTLSGDAEETAARIKALDARLGELYEPIEFIFEKKLKPGLNKLLTPQQQEWVAKHDAEVKAKRAAKE
ncbi:MAG: hypothetical protein IT449_12580 [Phycisphaerales bacterium]|nr:hypothetical protein [Phycisphaerales bacterium]